MAHFTITIPVAVGDRTIYRRVGALFENHNRDTGEVYYKIDLDFPVGATEMLAFPPRERGDEAAPSEGTASQTAGSGKSAT